MTRRRLTPEEEALWRKATQDVRHRSSTRKTVVSGPKETLHGKVFRGGGPSSAPAAAGSTGAPIIGRLLAAGPRAMSLSPREQHPFAAGDPRLERLAGRGRLAVDAVLDLHGHSQRTAAAALARFIADQQARGARCVLVVTGKGGPQTAQPAARAGQGRGVLRARLPDWLAEEPLRNLISRAAPAHARHGGGGAFYVFLKRRKPRR